MPQANKQKHYRVIRWKGRNVRSLVTFDITPKPQGVTKIIGPNGVGKSSAVDGLYTALGGASAEQALMIRHGQTEMDVTIDCGDFVSRRLVTQGKNELQLRDAAGKPIPRPQEFLSEKIGRISFDPLAVCKMKPPDRRRLLFDLAGITDAVATLDADIDKAKAKRGDAKTTHRDCVGKVRGMDAPGDDMPTERVSIAALLVTQRQRQKVADDNKGETDHLAKCEAATADAQRVVLDAEERLTKAQEGLAHAIADRDGQSDLTADMEDPRLEDINQQLTEADTLNQRIDAAANYRTAVTKRDKAAGVVGDYSQHIGRLELDKKALLADAHFPVPGLSFDLDDMCVNDTPFSQLSLSERIRLSFRIAAAMNPSLRVIRIEEGAELDTAAQAEVDALAREFDFQVLMECVADDDVDGDKGTVVIRDGHAVQVG